MRDGKIGIKPSILAEIIDYLYSVLTDTCRDSTRRRYVVVSCRSLANKFISERWDITPSQRRKYMKLFSTIQKHCRDIFQLHLNRGRVVLEDNGESYPFGVFKFSEIRENLTIGFVPLPLDREGLFNF